MTREEASKMAKAALECMEREVSGYDEMCNSHKCDECALNYEKGNMGEQKEWLRLVIKALEQQPKMGCWIEHFDESGKWDECDQCHTDWGGPVNYCPNCGAKMAESEEK